MTTVPRTGSRWTLTPVGFDAWDTRVTPYAGRVVEVTQPYGCPRNGTMGHLYVRTSPMNRPRSASLISSQEKS